MADKKENISSYVSTVLTIGSFCAGGLLFLGLGILFFHGLPVAGLRHPTFSVLFSQLLKGQPVAIINFGILVMMLTPFLRVLVAGFSFLLEKDVKYAAIAFGVMVILSFTIGPSFF
ncbi:MAG: DUF1634 domain-containing protein [Candidatus Zixiibacteriota bacterium]